MSVAIDAVGPSSSGTSSSGAPPSALSWSHTCSGTNRLVTVGVSYGAGGGYGGDDSTASLSATYDGVSMTSAGSRHTNDSNVGFAQLFYLVNPPTGAKTIVVSLSGWGGNTVDIIGGSVSFTGVNQSTPVQNYASAAGNTNNAALGITTSSSNMAVSVLATGVSITSDAQTSQWLNNLNGNTGAGNVTQSTGNSTSSVAFSYGHASDFWAVLGMDIVASAAPPTMTPIAWVTT